LSGGPALANRGNISGELYKLWRIQGLFHLRNKETKGRDRAKGVKGKQWARREDIIIFMGNILCWQRANYWEPAADLFF
jgi:hypothetical protein